MSSTSARQIRTSSLYPDAKIVEELKEASCDEEGEENWQPVVDWESAYDVDTIVDRLPILAF